MGHSLFKVFNFGGLHLILLFNFFLFLIFFCLISLYVLILHLFQNFKSTTGFHAGPSPTSLRMLIVRSLYDLEQMPGF